MKILKILLAIAMIFIIATNTSFAQDLEETEEASTFDKVKSFLKWFFLEFGAYKGSILPFDIEIDFVDIIFKAIINNILMTKTDFFQNSVIAKLFSINIKIVGALLVLAFTYVGLMSMLGRDVDFQSICIRMFGAAAIIVAIEKIMCYLIQYTNMIVNGLVNSAIGKDSIYNVVGKNVDSFVQLILLIVLAVLAIRLLIFYYIRYFEIIFIYLFSPYIAYLWLAGNDRIVSTCFKELLILIVTPLTHTIQLIILAALNSMSKNSITGSLEQIFLTIAAMLFMLQTPNWLSNLVHRIPESSSILSKIYNLATFSRERALLKVLKRK